MSSPVTIYHSKTHEKLCEIEAPRKWWSDIPVPLLFVWVSHHLEWKDPEAIEKWAWRQAWTIASTLNELGVVKRGDMLPADFTCRCIACGQNTFKPMARHWFWSSNYKHIGFACDNRNCGFFKVLLPSILLARIDDMPPEYLPWKTSE